MLPASKLYRAVRDFSVNSPVWDARRIIYFTDLGQRWDATLISQAVYGNRREYLAVMAAAGIDRFDEEITERQLVLPNAEALEAIKSSVGYKD